MHARHLEQTRVSIRILVLEDDPDLREQLADVLQDEGYDVDTAARGEEAVQKAREVPFDLIVADIRMEGMDGLEAISRVKADRPDVSSLVVSGYASESDTMRALKVGVADYLRKPFHLRDFLERVESVLAQRARQHTDQQRDSESMSTSLWALELLARTAQPDDAAEQAGAGILWHGRVAHALARSLGMDADAADVIRLSTLLTALRRVSAPLASSPLISQGPLSAPAVQRCLRYLDERCDGQGPAGLQGDQIPLESRVAAVALAARGCATAAEARTRLEADGGLDETLLSRLDAAWDKPRQDLTREAPDTRRRGLLSLARTLEELGDAAGADAAYRELVTETPTREGVAAMLGLARLSGRAGNAHRMLLLAQEAIASARNLGATAHGDAALESGLLLLQHDVAESAALLREAEGVLTDMQIEGRAALARVALTDPRQAADDAAADAALRTLMAPQHAPELVAAAVWLVPRLVARQADRPSTVVARVLPRLAREHTAGFERLLMRGGDGVQAAQRRVAREALEAAGGPAAQRLLAATATEVVRGGTSPTATEARSSATSPAGTADVDPAGVASTSLQAPLLRIHSFGPFTVFRGDARIAENGWKTQKIKYLFAYLASARGRTVVEDRILDNFWPDDVEKGRRNLYSSTSTLRKTLRPDGWGSELEYIVRSPAGLSLADGPPRWHDLDEFEDAATRAAAMTAEGRADEALEAYRRMAQLYRGPYLDGCYMEWALEKRDSIERQACDALYALCSSHLERGRAAEATDHAARLLEIDPCRQDAHLVMMRAFVALGRPEQAMRQYETCRRVLQKELEVEPSMALVEAYHRARLCL